MKLVTLFALLCALLHHITAEESPRATCWSCATNSLKEDSTVLTEPLVYDDRCFDDPFSWVPEPIGHATKFCTPGDCIEVHLLDKKNVTYGFRGCVDDFVSVLPSLDSSSARYPEGYRNCTHGNSVMPDGTMRYYNICICHNKHLCNDAKITEYVETIECWSCASKSLQQDSMVVSEPAVYDDRCSSNPLTWTQPPSVNATKTCRRDDCIAGQLFDGKTTHTFRGCAKDLKTVATQLDKNLSNEGGEGSQNCTDGTALTGDGKTRHYKICRCDNKDLCNEQNVTEKFIEKTVDFYRYLNLT